MLTIQAGHFVDQDGRVAQLRGANLSGSAKVPADPDGATWDRQNFYDTHNVSFVGRPLPLAEAGEHFLRLKTWGFNSLRLLVTWEAIEHAGPGIYDQAYLDYLYQLVKLAGEYEFYVLIDPHQDVWSRFTGGDGAPGWVFDLLGMDITKFHATGAAFTRQEHGNPLPRMSWVANYGKYACATLFTLFFGGDTFAPDMRVAGVPVQDFLQSHFFAALRWVADRLQGSPNILGYETLNEPSPGYIGYPHLKAIGAHQAAYGAIPTLYQGMLLAAGYPQRVRYKPSQFLPLTRSVRLNPAGMTIWKPGFRPIWQQYQVWDVDRHGRPHLLQPDYFNLVHGQMVNFERDFFSPFVASYAQQIWAVDPKATIFVTPPPREISTGEPGIVLPKDRRVVFAPHWYDGIAVASQRYLPWIGADTTQERMRFVLGRPRRRRLFAQIIQRILARAKEHFDDIPVVIGETGIPFNLHGGPQNGHAEFTAQTQAMDDVIQALESNCANFILWNYTPDNSPAGGDQWNGEDFSIFSPVSPPEANRTRDLYAGGRALPAVIRPYALRTPGLPLEMDFDLHTRVFKFTFQLDPSIQAPVEIYLPAYHYASGAQVEAPRGRVEIKLGEQVLRYYPDPGMPKHTLVIQPASRN